MRSLLHVIGYPLGKGKIQTGCRKTPPFPGRRPKKQRGSGVDFLAFYDGNTAMGDWR